MDRLPRKEYLNDNLVDFYLKYMQYSKMTVARLGGDGARDLDPQKISEVKVSSSLYYLKLFSAQGGGAAGTAAADSGNEAGEEGRQERKRTRKRKSLEGSAGRGANTDIFSKRFWILAPS